MAQETKQAYAGWHIRTGFLTGNLMGGENSVGADEAACIEGYSRALEAAVEKAFPGAIVSVRTESASGCEPRGLHQATGPEGMDWEDEDRVANEIIEGLDRIGEAVYADFDSWWVAEAKSSVAVLSADTWGAYHFVERSEFAGDLDDYLNAADAGTEVCPDDEVPVTHDTNGATILRTLHHNGGEDGTEDWYSYEAFWSAEA